MQWTEIEIVVLYWFSIDIINYLVYFHLCNHL